MTGQPQNLGEPRTDWPALLMSVFVPILVAIGFIHLAGQSGGWGWEMSPTWLYSLLALIPLEFIRIVVLIILAVVYADSSGPREALWLFLCLTVICAAAGLIWAAAEFGPRDVFALFAMPEFYKVLALPVLILLVDSAAGVGAFRGDPKVQSARLDAIGTDSYEWLVCAVFRIPIGVAAVVFLGFAFFDTPTDRWNHWSAFVQSNAARAIGFYYPAGYFLVKAAIIAHAFTAQFARTGKRFFEDHGALGRVLGLGANESLRDLQKANKRRV